LLDRSLDRLAAEMEAEGVGARYKRLEALLTEGSDDASYREIGRELGISEGAVKSAVHRMRRRFGRVLRDEVSQTVGDPEQVEDELRHLFAVLDT